MLDVELNANAATMTKLARIIRLDISELPHSNFSKHENCSNPITLNGPSLNSRQRYRHQFGV